MMHLMREATTIIAVLVGVSWGRESDNRCGM
jgi:hypothetical protein